jgi:hypothetical protein
MNKYKVTVAVTVPAYAEIEIEAESQAAAVQAAIKELDECEKLGVEVWDTYLWHDPTFEPAWQEVDDFRIVEG